MSLPLPYAALLGTLSIFLCVLVNSVDPINCQSLQEVEADKQNAAKLNALVQITSPTEDWPIGRRSSPDNDGRNRFRYSEQNRSQQSSSGPDSSAKCDTFGEVRKMMSGCLQHCPLVNSFIKGVHVG